MIEILNTGSLMTIQDNGRFGYRKFAVPESGALDQYSARLANWLVHKNENHPLIETILSGARIKFHETMAVGVTGAAAGCHVNGKFVPDQKTIYVQKGDTLEIRETNEGLATYISFSGDIEMKEILGSVATYMNSKLGGINGEALKKGDQLIIRAQDCAVREIPRDLQRRFTKSYSIRLMKGPEYDLMEDQAKKSLLSSPFRVSEKSNRIGFRLLGEDLHASTYDIASRPVFRGTVQLTPSGPILLMNDCQTTGGYPRIAQVIHADLDYCGQLAPGNTVRFRKVDLREARMLWKNLQSKFKDILD